MLTNEHPDTMLTLCFLDSPDPKMSKPPKTGSRKFARLPKFPMHSMMGNRNISVNYDKTESETVHNNVET